MLFETLEDYDKAIAESDARVKNKAPITLRETTSDEDTNIYSIVQKGKPL